MKMIWVWNCEQVKLWAGVSETERRRREESNHFGAKITFIAWLFEVFLKTKSALGTKKNQKISGSWRFYPPPTLSSSSAYQVVETMLKKVGKPDPLSHQIYGNPYNPYKWYKLTKDGKLDPLSHQIYIVEDPVRNCSSLLLCGCGWTKTSWEASCVVKTKTLFSQLLSYQCMQSSNDHWSEETKLIQKLIWQKS